MLTVIKCLIGNEKNAGIKELVMDLIQTSSVSSTTDYFVGQFTILMKLSSDGRETRQMTVS